MGLISKAIKRVEKKESFPAPQEMEPQPKKKKKVVILLACLLFIGLSLSLGYLFLLKPTSEVPSHVTRRSVGAKKTPLKPPTKQTEQKKDTVEVSTMGREMESASEKILEKSVVPEEPIKEVGKVSEQKEETSIPEQKLPALLGESLTSPSKKEPKTPKSKVKEEASHPISSVSSEEEKTPAEITPSEAENEDPSEYISEEPATPEQEEIPSEEVAPSYSMEWKKWLAQQSLTVTEKSDSRAQRYYNKGVSYHLEGEFNRAIDSYKKALIFNPDHLPAHVNLATAYLQMGRFKEAEKELIYVYALRPKDQKVLFNFGFLLYQTGEYASAETKLKKLLEFFPFHLEANLLLASVYEKRGEFDKAIEFCTKAYRINSTDPCVLYRLGRTWDLVGETAKALEYYQLFLKRDSGEENQLRLAVHDRMNYLLSCERRKGDSNTGRDVISDREDN